MNPVQLMTKFTEYIQVEGKNRLNDHVNTLWQNIKFSDCIKSHISRFLVLNSTENNEIPKITHTYIQK